MNVKYSFGNVRTMTLHLTTCRVNIWGYLNPIPINRVKKPVAYTLGQTYSPVACVSEHAVLQHFFGHFINVFEIGKKHFHRLAMHINKTF